MIPDTSGRSIVRVHLEQWLTLGLEMVWQIGITGVEGETS